MPTHTLSEQQLINRVLRADRQLRRAAVNAIVAARDAPGTLRQLSRLIRQGRIEDAVSAAARAGAIEMAGGSAAVYVESGKQTAAWLATVLKVTVDFDQVHDLAVQRMRANRLNLVREWTDIQRNVVRETLGEGVRLGEGPVAQARRFRRVTGLTTHQEGIVRNYRTLLNNAATGDLEALNRKLRDARFDRTVLRAAEMKMPIPPDKIDKMVDRYRARLLKRRAETIARTEALSSVHAGNHDAFEQAVDDGLIGRDDVKRIWYSAADERVRPDHIEADGQQVPFDQPFLVGGEPMMFPGDPNASGDQRINCRCVVGTRVRT